MYAHKTDLTHRSIRDTLRDEGYSVFDTAELGRNFPDLVVGRYGITLLVECKTPRGLKTAQERLSAGQSTFALAWKGSPVIAAYCSEDVVFAFNLECTRKGWSR